MSESKSEFKTYVCHNRYKKIGASGKEYNIRRGTQLVSIAGFIAMGNESVCATTSEDAHMYFACDDNGKELERGELTHDIAHSDRRPNKNNGYRFTESQIEMLEKEYPHFLRNDTDTIIFNNEFFNADVEQLREMKDRLQAV